MAGEQDRHQKTHTTQQQQAQTNLDTRQTRKVYVFNRANSENIVVRLNNLREEFLNTWTDRDVEGNWKYSKENILDIVKENVPTRTIKGNADLPWFTRKIKKLLNKLKRRYKRAKSTNVENDWELYKDTQKELKLEIKVAHDAYLENIFDTKENQIRNKRLWAYIKSLKRDKTGISALRQNGELFTTDIGKAKVLSDHFKNVFTEENSNIPVLDEQMKLPPMDLMTIDTKGVEILLKDLNVSKALGPDLIPTSILKEHADIIAPIITVIFRQSIETSSPVEDWLTANVLALYKNKGNRLDACSYRPISLTCIICKVLEHIILSNIMNHYDEYQILNKNQHGFQKGHSCETQLINTIDDLAKALDSKETIHCLILDFAKAFDTVPHKRLIKILYQNGITENIVCWIKKWLTKRTQSVIIDDVQSEVEPVISGVPQGTVLGPLLFLSYINNISDGISSSMKLFADDCLLFRKIRNQDDSDKLQEDLDQISQWCEKWQMSLNINKCKLLEIKSKLEENHNVYVING